MRGIRTTTVTTFLAAGLLAGSAVGVVAQDAAEPGPAAYVHGLMAEGYSADNEFETYDDDGNRLTLRGSAISGRMEMDDARLSGAWEMTVSIDEFPQPGMDERVEVHWGELTITNGQGDWSGTWKSTYDASHPDGLLLGVYELTGAGAYEGLSALLAPTGSLEDRPGLPLAGAIVPSPLPPDSAYGE